MEYIMLLGRILLSGNGDISTDPELHSSLKPSSAQNEQVISNSVFVRWINLTDG
jgi:hypothetical protein